MRESTSISERYQILRPEPYPMSTGMTVITTFDPNFFGILEIRLLCFYLRAMPPALNHMHSVSNQLYSLRFMSSH